MQIVPDYIELELTAKDVVAESKFKVAFKLLEAKTARAVLKRLYRYSYEAQCAVLVSNIVYISQLSDSKGNLTNSFEKRIIRELLESMPYFKSILGNFVALLRSIEQIQRQGLKEQNLFEAGKWQYELDYGKQDLESKIAKETSELQDSLGEFMNFEDEPAAVVANVEEAVVTQAEKLPELLWQSNLPFLKIFNIAKFYQNEWGVVNPVVLIELAKEAGLLLSETLSYIPVVQAGYNSLKPKETT